MLNNSILRRPLSSSLSLRLCASAVILFAIAAPASAATNLAVFNFQLKTGQEDWVWLEKFMSDQMATDLVQDRSLSVVARDRMQLLAQQMKWVPEFATTDAKVMGGIRASLGIEYLVTGVCGVAGDQLEITGQVVEVASRKEVFRKTVSGTTAQVIDLQKQLSSEVIAWFTKRPAEQILKTLPMWTRSIPAVRALYEGMHLYDQGRYAEGWAKFRQSSQEDKNYVEAVYWVGKMYYFMYRYDHARRTLEKFVYLDCLHPRMGDAIMEYVHTFEAGGATNEELLALYNTVADRFPSMIIFGDGRRQTAGGWARIRRDRILSRTQSDQEVEIVKPGTVVVLAGVGESTMIFPPDTLTQTYRFPEPGRIYGRATLDRDKEAIFRAEEYSFTLNLSAPSGLVFTSLRFQPLASGSDATVTVALRDRRNDIDPITAPLTEAGAAGIVLRRTPRRSMLSAKCTFTSKDAKARCVAVEGITISATFEKVAEHGAVEVQCSNTDDFRVDIDGVFGRWSSGLVGLLSPGRHQLTMRPVRTHSPLGTWTATVDVQAGKVARVVGTLPWRNQTRDSVITGRVLSPKEPLKPYMFAVQPAPAIYLDDRGIRMIWSQGGDLWASVSTDGNSFGKPEILPLPVSTAWQESDPRLFRDESGRFVLTFISDRDGQHRKLAYLCWSRDLVNWSNPCVISDTPCRDYDVIQGPDGRYFCAIADTPDDWSMITLFSSRDGYRWEAMPGKQVAFNISPVRIAARSDGAIELYAVPTLPGTQWRSGRYDIYKFRMKPAYKQLVRFVHDGRDWSPKEVLTGFTYDESTNHISLARDARGLVVLATAEFWSTFFPSVQIVREEDGRWQSTGPVRGCALYSGELAYHPRWGYVMSHGGYFTRSHRLPELIAEVAAETPKPTIVEPNPIANGRTHRWSPDGRINEVHIPFPPLPVRAPRGAKLPPPKPGELRFKTPEERNFAESIRIEDPDRFARPTSGCGTVHPNAVVVTVEHNGLPVSIALDSDDPNSVHYELARLDFSGKGDFHDAVTVHREGMWFYPPIGKYLTTFKARPAYVKIGGKVIPVYIGIEYAETDQRMIRVFLRASVEGMCLFGDKQYKVEIYDDNNNLRLGDAAWPGSKKGHDSVVVSCRPGVAPIVRYGEPVSIDGKLYDVRISADGNSVTALDYKGPAGFLKIGRPAWNAWLLGENTKFTVAGGMDPVPVPPGEYKVVYYNEFSSSDGTKPRYRLSNKGAVDVHVKSGESVSVDIGSPITGKLTAEVSGRIVRFQYAERDASGSRVNIERPGQQIYNYERSVRIVDSNSKAVIGLKMQVKSGLDGWDVTWSVREGLSGTFTATVEADAGPFIPKPATATFTVK